jgi:aspartate aminotransferase
LTVVPPAGAFYLFPHCGGLLGQRTRDGKVLRTDEDVVLYLLDAAGVATVQGAAFGLSPHFRISFATSEMVLTDAVARIAVAVADLR